ncbi:hypothetical protein pb186bvf_007021 [Paramecium bursaria]
MTVSQIVVSGLLRIKFLLILSSIMKSIIQFHYFITNKKIYIMQNTLLRKSNSYNNPQNTQPQLQASIEENMKNFRVNLSDMSKKNLSDDSEPKDPTIYSQKKSRLSQFSQMNLPKDQQPTGTMTKKQDFTVSRNDSIHDKIRRFWEKFKRSTTVGAQFQLRERYLEQIQFFQESSDLSWWINQLIQLFLYALQFTIPIQMSGTYQLNIFNIILNLIVFSHQILLLWLQTQKSCNYLIVDYLEYISNILFSVTGLILCTIDPNVNARISLLVILVILKLISYQNDLMCLGQFILNEFLYINLMMNLWIIYNKPDNQVEHSQAFLWAIQNIVTFINYQELPFGSGDYQDQLFSGVVKCFSFLFQIYMVSKFVHQLFQESSLKLFRSYLDSNKISKQVTDDALIQIKQLQRQSTNKNLEAINQFIQMLPSELNKQINHSIKGKLIKQNQFFSSYFSLEMIEYMAQHSETICLKPNQILVTKGQIDDNVYIIVKGFLKAYDTQNERVFIKTVTKGFTIGLEHQFLNEGQQLLYESYGFSLLIKITRQVFLQSTRLLQSDLETYSEIKQDLLFNQNIELLKQECLICESFRHLTSQCDSMHLVLDKTMVLAQHLYSLNHDRTHTDRSGFRVNTKLNHKIIQDAAKLFCINNQIKQTSQQSDEINETYVQDELYEQNVISQRDFTNPSYNEKQKSIEYVSGQTLKDLREINFLDHNYHVFDHEEIDRHQQIKQTIQTAGFQGQAEYEQSDLSGMNIPMNHKTFTQNSNTFKSSSGQHTYHSQKSQQRQPQKVHVTAPPLDGKQRNQQPKLTFQYDPNQDNLRVQQIQAQYDQRQFRPSYRSSTQNYVQNKSIPAIQYEDGSQLNIPFQPTQQPFASNMSLSSVGLASIDDHIRIKDRTNSNTKKLTIQRNTQGSAISPGKALSDKKKSMSNSNTNSYLDSNKMQFQSDFEEGNNPILFKISLDIDRIKYFSKFKPMENADKVVRNISNRQSKLN